MDLERVGYTDGIVEELVRNWPLLESFEMDDRKALWQPRVGVTVGCMREVMRVCPRLCKLDIWFPIDASSVPSPIQGSTLGATTSDDRRCLGRATDILEMLIPPNSPIQDPEGVGAFVRSVSPPGKAVRLNLITKEMCQFVVPQYDDMQVNIWGLVKRYLDLTLV